MTILSIPALIMAVVAFYISGYHLLIYFRRPESRVDLTFAFTALCIGFYDVCCVALYNATSPLEGVQIQRWQLISLSFLSISYVWFVVDYTSMKSRFGPWFFSGVFIIFALIGFFDKSGLAWTDQSLIKNFQFPFFGWDITYYEMEFGKAMLWEAFMLMVFYLYLYLVAVHFYWNKNPKRAKPLALAIGIFFLGMTEDVSVALGYYSFIYTIEYAFMGMVLVMAYTLSSEIVERTKIKQELRDSEAKHKTMIANISDVIAILGTDSTIKYKSPNIEKWFDWLPDDLIDSKGWDTVHPDDLERIQKEFFDLLDQDGSVKTVEYRYKCKDGSYKPIELTAVNLTKDSTINGILTNYHDITERKKAETEIRTLNRDLELRVHQRTVQLEEANKELEDFVYSVSHDLRAPLRSISGFAEIIDRRHKASLNEEGQHYFDNIVKAGRQMGDLIDDLLQFSRLGRKAIKPEPVALDDVVKSATETLADIIKKTDARINIPEQMPVIQGDMTLAIHIFVNLLENALKYRKPNELPIIDMGVEADNRYVEISIADNGIGIESEYHDKIFKMFQRLHSQADYPGTGIGLAAVKKALQMMGGEVFVESELGKGSVFKVRLLKATAA